MLKHKISIFVSLNETLNFECSNAKIMKKINAILGAVIGDTLGSIYEFNPTKDYHFQIFDEKMQFTDDSVLTVAVADWLQRDKSHSSAELVKCLQTWGRKYDNPMGGYGGMFLNWLWSNNPQPYNSWGNGSAMRVSAVGEYSKNLEEALSLAEISSSVTHNHAEGIKGAQATAAAIFLAKSGTSKQNIRQYLSLTFGYNLERNCDEIRPTYGFEGSCQETVPQALVAFFDSCDFEDAIRLTISLGGDADTMGAITGAIAAAFYKEIPDNIYQFVWNQLPAEMQNIISAFNQH